MITVSKWRLFTLGWFSGDYTQAINFEEFKLVVLMCMSKLKLNLK